MKKTLLCISSGWDCVEQFSISWQCHKENNLLA